MSNDLVVKSNVLIEAHYYLTTLEQRLVLSAIAKIPKNQPVLDTEVYFVTMQDFIELGSHPTNATRDLKTAVKKLYDREIKFQQNGFDISTRWLQQRAIKVDDDNSVIGIRFSTPILPYLTNINANFTKYLKADIAGVKSTYSIRFYEMICQYRKKGTRRIKIDELRKVLDLGKKYPLTADLKKRVIQPAINEINNKSPMRVSYEFEKTGQAITHLQLSFYDTRAKKQKERRGLTDKQIGKIAYHKDSFIFANMHMVTDKNLNYYQIFESFKPLLADPDQLTKFNLVKTYLALKPNETPPAPPPQTDTPPTPTAPPTTPQKALKLVLNADQIDRIANHPDFLSDYPMKNQPIGCPEHIEFLKFRLEASPASFQKRDLLSYL